VRLGTCIALELGVALGALGGVWIGVGRTLDLAGEYLTTREAAAATSSPAPSMALARVPAALLELEPPAAAPTVFGAPDEVLLAPLAGNLARVKPNKGGTSLSLRVDFASGGRASFKPEQTWPQSDPRREVAAYRIDRMLGIGRVPPAKPIKIPLAQVIEAADPEYRTYTTRRLADEAIARNGELRGMVSWWIPEIRDAKLGPLRVDELESIREWVGYLQVGATIPPDARPMVEQLATCIVFDVITDNADRWSGANTKASPDQRTLYFMDNTLSFSKFTHGHDTNLKPFLRLQVFPRALVGKLRGLTFESLNAALSLGDDPVGLGPLLSPVEVRAILARRDHVIAHIDGLIAQYGEGAVLALP
jgi:hypothetical protein